MPRKNKETDPQLTRRERQIMDTLFELGEATVEDVRSRLPDPPSYSAARAMLAKLEAKGHARHAEKNLRYVYSATVSRDRASRSAVTRLVQTFFEGSMERAIAGMIHMTGDQLPDDELERLSETIERARKERKKGKR